MPPLIKVLISLRFFISGSFQIIIADTFNVDQSTVSRAALALLINVIWDICINNHGDMGYSN